MREISIGDPESSSTDFQMVKKTPEIFMSGKPAVPREDSWVLEEILKAKDA